MTENLYRLFEATSEGYIYLAALAENDIYKIGKTTNPEGRFFWLKKEYNATEFIALWEVPDLDYCERVALSMTRHFTVSGEIRSMTPEQAGTFTKEFSGFVKCLDAPEFESGSKGIIKFIYWDEAERDVFFDQFDDRLSVDLLKRVAKSIITNGENFSRPSLCKNAKLSQSKYHILKEEFERVKFVVCRSGNRTDMTKLGIDFLRDVISLNAR